ncbi:MAG: peptide ABC transporter substrate-binding protein [Candidatus Aquilonibacter sp.]|jgi:peptide/nickel transport system substrate-binding protein
MLFVLLTAACTTRTGAPFSATTLIIGQQQEPISLNPALENGQRSTQWGELLFSYLVKFDHAGKLVGDVATQVPSLANGGISRDGRTITYHLRTGVRFADGVALTAHDCVWSIDAIKNRANNVQSRYGYDRVVASDAPNDRTLVLHLRAPFAPVLSIVLAPQGFPILPEHLLAKYPDFNNLAFNAQPIGSGPYVVERWLRDDRVEMRANPYYFLGEPAIRHLTVRFIASPAGGTNELETHEIQAYFNEQDYSQYPLLLGLRGYAVQNSPMSAVDAMIFNTQGSLTNDPAVRHALAEAVDVRTLVAKAYRGALDGRHAARGLFLWAYDPRAFPDVPYDPRAARAMLQHAGWVLGPDGVRQRAGRALDLLLVIQAGVPGEAIAANLVVQYERAVGASVTIKQFAVTQFGAPASMGGPVYGGRFDVALYSFVNGDDPDTTDQFACSNIPPNGYNKSRICDVRIDALLAAGRETYDILTRKAIYARLQALLYEQLPMVLLYQRRELDVFPALLRGPSGSIDSVFWDAARWRFVGAATAAAGRFPPPIGNGVGLSLTDSSKTLDWMPRTPETL